MLNDNKLSIPKLRLFCPQQYLVTSLSLFLPASFLILCIPIFSHIPMGMEGASSWVGAWLPGGINHHSSASRLLSQYLLMSTITVSQLSVDFSTSIVLTPSRNSVIPAIKMHFLVKCFLLFPGILNVIKIIF